MDKFYLIFFMSFLLSVNIIAQTAHFASAPSLDKIEVYVNQEDGKYFIHRLKAGETVYAISRKYQVKTKDILSLNKVNDVNDIDINTALKIPLNTALLTHKPSNKAMVYKAQAKDNIYRISKVYFDIPMEAFMKLNQLKSLNLYIDQEFIVGYLSSELEMNVSPSKRNEEIEVAVKADTEEIEGLNTEEEPDSLSTLQTKDISTKNKLFSDSTLLEEKLDISKGNLRQTRGIAIWNKNSRDVDNMFALHRTARVGSIVEIYNPLLKRRAFAKVVASIPAGVYPGDVSIILSKRVVDSLGALDGRFQVEMKFYE